MRKDVKIGLAVGGIVLLILIIYVLSVPGEKPAGTGGQASNLTTPNPAPAPTTPPPPVVTTPPPAPAATQETPPITSTPPTTAADPFASGRTTTGPADNSATAGGAAEGRDWDWNRLLENGGQVSH